MSRVFLVKIYSYMRTDILFTITVKADVHARVNKVVKADVHARAISSFYCPIWKICAYIYPNPFKMLFFRNFKPPSRNKQFFK